MPILADAPVDDIGAEAIQLLTSHDGATLRAPSAGPMLKLHAPAAPELGDVLAAARVGFSVLPRRYVDQPRASR